MLSNKPEAIRVDAETLRNLRQYCLDKHGRVYGKIMEEASTAIREHIKRDCSHVTN